VCSRADYPPYDHYLPLDRPVTVVQVAADGGPVSVPRLGPIEAAVQRTPVTPSHSPVDCAVCPSLDALRAFADYAFTVLAVTGERPSSAMVDWLRPFIEEQLEEDAALEARLRLVATPRGVAPVSLLPTAMGPLTERIRCLIEREEDDPPFTNDWLADDGFALIGHPTS